jgi:hypothetical protein
MEKNSGQKSRATVPLSQNLSLNMWRPVKPFPAKYVAMHQISPAAYYNDQSFEIEVSQMQKL